MHTQVIIHLLPHEIDWFEWQSKQLKIGSYYINKNDKITFDVVLNLNLVDWNISKIPKEFFITKFNQIKQLYDWCDVIFEIDEEQKCMGCGDKRKQSIQSSTADNIVYLDSDIIFKPETLFYLIEGAKNVNNKYYIISPQITRLWDSSWDLLVNNNYMSVPPLSENYANRDPFRILIEPYGDTLIKSINSFKLGGGWFNLFSTNLLKLTDIPDSLNPYGPDDTYVMYCCDILKNNKYDVQQYVLHNLVVIENIKYRYDPYSDYLFSDNYMSEIKRKDFRANTEKNLGNEINNFYNKIKNG